MSLTIHPKTSGAALGTALGILIVAVLDSIHGISLAPELPAAISGFLATLGAFLAPGDVTVPPAAVAAAVEASLSDGAESLVRTELVKILSNGVQTGGQ